MVNQSQTTSNGVILKERECYWIPHPSKVYTLVMVKEIDQSGLQCIVTPCDGSSNGNDQHCSDFELDIKQCPFFPVNPSSVEDMTSLHYLHEAGILSNLEERSKIHHHTPYTYVANVLVAVNPLHSIPPTAFENYKGIPISAREPHPYGIAEMAYRQMILPRLTERNQSVIISGESGAGKTETAKIVLKYLCWRSSQGVKLKNTKTTSIVSKPLESTLDSRLLQSNPILEAFGNAKTQRNDNSSRFGKFLKLQFNEANEFSLMAAGIETYLLETSRVVSVTEGERNYHVFYQLLSGSPAQLRKKWRLKDIKSYRYLTQSSELYIDGVEDSSNFSILCSALAQLGLQPQLEQDCLFKSLNAVLSLGNIDFDDVLDVNKLEAARVSESYTVDRVAELLGVDRFLLEQALITKYIDMTGTNTNNNENISYNNSDTVGKLKGQIKSIRSPRNAAQAAYARDAMAKAIYQRIFDWIVKRICESLNQSSENHPYIGVLDIFGFEDFLTNGLEQLLINYANEALQLIYTKEILVSERELFIAEGLIDESKVNIGNEINSNLGCINLIAKSIIPELDACCVRAGTEEEVFISNLHEKIKDNKFFPLTKSIDRKEKFKVKHFAKPVTYTVGNFISRNMDIKLTELNELLLSSTHSIKCGLFSDSASLNSSSEINGIYEIASTESLDKDDLPLLTRQLRSVSSNYVDNVTIKNKQNSETDCNRNSMRVNSPAPRKISIQHQNLTVGAAFVKKMASLAKVLESTKCSFIRCIKPNSTMTPGKFEGSYVVEQLRCLGVVQTCEVLKAGLPTRIGISELENMYRPLLPPKLQKILHNTTDHGFVKAIMWVFQIPSDSYKIGRTKVFFRIGKISMLSEITEIDMNSERGVWLAKRLSKFVSRQWWRKAAVRKIAENAWLDLFYLSKKRVFAVGVLKYCWWRYKHSNKKRRKDHIHRLWRKAIVYTTCQVIFVREFQLIREARSIREANEAAAEVHLQTIQRLAQQNEERAQEATKKYEETDLEIKNKTNENLQNSDDANISERRRAMSNATEAITAFDTAKCQSEMQALIAASGLATVSVCLFRWTKIKLFAAFETWLDILPVKNNEGTSRRISTLKKQSSFESIESLDREAEDVFPFDDTESVVGIAKSNVNIARILLQKRNINRDYLDNSFNINLCYECADREPAIWCAQCVLCYCKVCSQFVHSSCKFMKCHLPMLLSDVDMKEVSLLAQELPTANKMVISSNTSASKLSNKQDECHESKKLDCSPSIEIGQPTRRKSFNQRRPTITAKSFHTMGMARGGSNIITSEHEPCAIKSCEQPACKGVSIRFCEQHYEEFRSNMKGGSGGTSSDEEHKTLQQQVALLKKQLQESGQQPVEFVELSVARQRMQEAVERLMGGDEKAEKEIERWDKTIRMNPDYQKEMEEKAKKWEEDQYPINMQCLLKMRGIIPPNVSSTSMSSMMADGLPESIAKRIWTKKSLWMICTHPEDLKKIHIADLTTKYGNQGLDIVEMRAIYVNLPTEFENDGDGKKLEWRKMFRQKLEELTIKEASNRLGNMEKRNPAYKGHDNLCIYDPNVVIARAAVQKSTAFDATEKPTAVTSTLGEGIKDIKKQMSEKPICEGTLIHCLGGSANPDGQEIALFGVLILGKKTLFLYKSQSAAKEGDETGMIEMPLQKTYCIKLLAGKLTFAVMDGEIELKVFKCDKEKDKRDKWMNAFNEVFALLNKTPMLPKSKALENETTLDSKVDVKATDKPSFLAGITSGKKSKNDVSEFADEKPIEKPSFLAGITNRKKKESDIGSGMSMSSDNKPPEKPSFLSAIAAKKQKEGDENQEVKPESASKPSFLSAIANRKPRTEDI